ncbi:quinate permease [Gautieria morchelliformis]|nr:quinate permease [Gautieria morchelliformis]
MQLSLKEDRPTPKEVYNFRMYLFAVMVSFGSVEFGYDSGFIGSTLALQSFKDAFRMNNLSTAAANNISSNIVSVFQGGCFFGALLALPISDRYGRRISLIISSNVFIIGSLLQTFANGSLNMMYAGRTLNGLGVGSATSIIPVFIAEFSPPAVRGRVVGIYEIMYQIGALVGFWINYGTALHIPNSSTAQWRIPIAVQIIPGSLLFISMFVWESPRWLAQRGLSDRCLSTLSRVRKLPRDHPYILAEMQDMRSQLEREDKVGGGASYWQLLKELSKRGHRNRVGLGVGMMVFQNLSGINAINYYSPTIFRSLGVAAPDAALFATGIYAVVKLVVSVVFLVFLVDRMGRRRALLIGSVGSAVSMWYIGVYIFLGKPSSTDVGRSPGGWAAIAAIYIFVVFYCASWNGIAWIIPSEIFTVRTRTLGVTITTMTQWLMQFVITKSTPFMITSIGYGTYFFFGASMSISFVWVWFLLPETKGLRLEDMDVIFGLPESHNSTPEEKSQQQPEDSDEKDAVEPTIESLDV